MAQRMVLTPLNDVGSRETCFKPRFRSRALGEEAVPDSALAATMALEDTQERLVAIVKTQMSVPEVNSGARQQQWRAMGRNRRALR